MFTGLIEEIGIVKGIEKTGNGVNITISAKIILEGINTGDSLSIDGACQTVIAFSATQFTVFASKVTCEASTLGQFKQGRKVNLERALHANARFGGHIVQGHVDGKGKIISIIKDESGITIGVSIPKVLLKYIAAKGSISVDGVSLTVVSISNNGILLYIIPETVKNTTLTEKILNSEVNIEVDILAKYVEQLISAGREESQNKDGNLKRTLFEEGFM
jgi:riboflavin synthase